MSYSSEGGSHYQMAMQTAVTLPPPPQVVMQTAMQTATTLPPPDFTIASPPIQQQPQSESVCFSLFFFYIVKCFLSVPGLYCHCRDFVPVREVCFCWQELVGGGARDKYRLLLIVIKTD